MLERESAFITALPGSSVRLYVGCWMVVSEKPTSMWLGKKGISGAESALRAPRRLGHARETVACEKMEVKAEREEGRGRRLHTLHRRNGDTLQGARVRHQRGGESLPGEQA
jgi:hypothetical protein